MGAFLHYPMAALLGEKEDDNMYKPTYEQVIQYAKDYTYVPICREILADDMTPILEETGKA